MTADDLATCRIVGGHRPPLQCRTQVNGVFVQSVTVCTIEALRVLQPWLDLNNMNIPRPNTRMDTTRLKVSSEIRESKRNPANVPRTTPMAPMSTIGQRAIMRSGSVRK